MRLDLKLIASLIEPGSRVLDIGSGDGTLIEHLFRTRGCDARGIEIDMAEVTRAVAHGLPVMHGDADNDLSQYPDNAFDYVVLTRTLQAVERPREVLRQMLRIGTRAVVSFPNFGHWQVRLGLLRTGRMPVTSTWSRMWYETPNIHPCTILDFRELCAQEGYAVEQWLAIDDAGRKSPWRRSLHLANIFGEQAMFLMRKKELLFENKRQKTFAWAVADSTDIIMDIAAAAGSHIITVSRAAFARPDTDFLCFGESDVPAPASAHAALAAAMQAGQTRYSDVRGLPALRQALAEHLTAQHANPVDESRVQITGSGMAAVSVAMAALLRPEDRLVHLTPAWPNSANAARMRGAAVEEFPLDATPDGGFRLDLDRLATRLAGARALWINSPSNPTGWTASAADIRGILEICRATGTWLIADEVYNRLVYDDEHAASILDWCAPDDRVLVVGSFSKAWAMTGFRIGWLIVPHATRDSFSELVEITHSGVAAFVQAAALAALGDSAFVRDFRAYCAAGRTMTTQALSRLSRVRFAAPPGAFYAFIGVDGLQDSLGFALRLVHTHGVAVAPGCAFGAGGEGHLRLCFAQSPMLLERALERLSVGLKE